MADNEAQEGLTRKEVAQRFGVSVGTIRSWQRNFKAWLEVEQQEYGGGRRQATLYSDNDLKVFAVVARLTKTMAFDAIRERMDEELASATYELPPEEPEEEQPGSAMVPYNQFSAVVARLQGAEGKLEAIEDERDWLRERVETVEKRREEEREQFKAEKDELQKKLDEERQKSWWQRLRGH